MFRIIPLPPFTKWLQSLKDSKVRSVIAARIKRLSHGLPGDVRPVAAGVSELRIHLGAGWRVYFKRCGTDVIVLLAGGNKQDQQKDIALALDLAKQAQWPAKEE